MSSKNKNILMRDTSVRTRDFSYSIGDVSLKFTLRTDIKGQLKDFSEILDATILDVKEELSKH